MEENFVVVIIIFKSCVFYNYVQVRLFNVFYIQGVIGSFNNNVIFIYENNIIVGIYKYNLEGLLIFNYMQNKVYVIELKIVSFEFEIYRDFNDYYFFKNFFNCI